MQDKKWRKKSHFTQQFLFSFFFLVSPRTSERLGAALHYRVMHYITKRRLPAGCTACAPRGMHGTKTRTRNNTNWCPGSWCCPLLIHNLPQRGHETYTCHTTAKFTAAEQTKSPHLQIKQPVYGEAFWYQFILFSSNTSYDNERYHCKRQGNICGLQSIKRLLFWHEGRIGSHSKIQHNNADKCGTFFFLFFGLKGTWLRQFRKMEIQFCSAKK